MASSSMSVLLCVVVCILYSGVNGKYVLTPFGQRHELCVRKEGTPRKHTTTCEQAVADFEAAQANNAEAAASSSSGSSASSGSGVADGTMAYSIASADTNIVSASAEFNVPDAPLAKGATVFIAFALSDSTWVAPAPLPYPDMLSLEATLQWGKTAAGQVEGQWGMAVWSKDFYGDIVFSELVAVPQNAILSSSMQLASSGTWKLNMTAMSSTGTLSVGIEVFNKTVPAEGMYFGMLRYDAYFTALCDALPPSGSEVVFSGVSLTLSNGPWNKPGMWVPGGVWAVPMCGTYPDVVSSTETRLYLNVCKSAPANTPGCTAPTVDGGKAAKKE